MIDHCAYCVHRANAPDGENCSYEVDGYDFHKKRRPCRELTEWGATYRCFKADVGLELDKYTAGMAQNRDVLRLQAVVDSILQALDKLEWRIANIEEGLRIATRR